jgi:hypothetical protein
LAVASFDPATARFSILREVGLSQATFASLEWQDGGVSAHLGAESLVVAAAEPAGARQRSQLAPPPITSEGRLASGSPGTAAVIDLAPVQDGMMSMGLFAGPDGFVYGATYWNTWLFRVDARSDRLEPLGRVAGAAGEFRVGQATDDRHILLPGYSGQLFLYDVKKPWRDEPPDPNPRHLGALGEGQHLAFGVARRADGLIAVATPPTYGYTGGAVTFFDPSLDRRTTVARPAGEQALHAVAFGSQGLLFAGTSNESGPGAGRVGGEAQLLTISPDTGEVLDRRVPVPGAKAIGGLVALDGHGILGGTDNGRLFTYDVGREVALLDLQPGHVRGLAWWPEERAVIGLSWSQGVFLLDPMLRFLSFIEGAPERVMPGIAFDGQGRAHVHDGRHVYRIGRRSGGLFGTH